MFAKNFSINNKCEFSDLEFVNGLLKSLKLDLLYELKITKNLSIYFIKLLCKLLL